MFLSTLSKDHQHPKVQDGRAHPKWKMTQDVSSENPIIIVGAGITGLAISIALSDLSFPSIVLERRSNYDLLTGGAGINLQEKAITCLNELGVSTSSIIENGNVILKQSYYCPDGRHVCTLDKKGSKEGNPKQVAIHRGALMKLLLSKVKERKDNVQLLEKCCVRNVRTDEEVGQVTVEISSEENEKESDASRLVNGSVVLAADGINSKIRNQMFKDKADPCTFHGVTHYRGMAKDFPTFLDGQTMLVIGGTEVKFVIYPITSPKDGKQTINWVFCVREKVDCFSSSIEQLQQHLLDILEQHKYNLDFLNLKSLVEETDLITPWPMVDLEPLDSWVENLTALVGDAAHATLPVGSGGAMAGLLDALALKEAFAKSGPVPCSSVLKLFQALRYKDALKYQQKCRLQPAENILQEIINQGQNLEEIPSSHSEKIYSEMRKLHAPTTSQSARTPVDKRVLIVGCGASGIASCKEFLENGYEPVVFESGPTIGGVFRDAYKTLELTSSSAFTAFSDFPPTEKVPTMWTSSEYLTYLHSYAVDNNLFPYIQFNKKVVGIRRINSTVTSTTTEETPLVDSQSNKDVDWEVTIQDVNTGSTSTILGKNLVLCVGSNARPNKPNFLGQEMFEGKIVHTSEIDGFEMFRGKRVLCLGLGESGSDVPYWIAKEPGTKVTVAYRGKGWLVPRRRPLRTGLPTDLNTNRMLWGLPRFYNKLIFFLLSYFDSSSVEIDPVLNRMGRMNRSHPDGVYKTYGTKSVHFLYAAEHLGLELIASTISKISSKSTVEFENGTMGDFDVILLNTGYQRSTFEGFCHDPIEEELHDKNLFEILKQSSNVRYLYKRMIHPRMENLFFVGFARPGFGSIPAIAELQARYAAALVAKIGPKFPSEAEMISSIAEDKAKDDAQFNGSAKRIGALVDYVPFVNSIAALLGASPPLFKYALTDPYFFVRLFVGPATVAQFRLIGPNAKPSIARNTIESYPLPTKRRLHIISLGLYVSSLIVLVLSLFIPLTSKTRKALMPVGFAPIQQGFVSRLRYIIGCAHIAALGYFYAYIFQIETIGFAVVFLTAAFEISGLFKRAKYERELSVLLSTPETYYSHNSSKTNNFNGKGSFSLLTSITKVLVVLGLQGSISQSNAFQNSFQAAKASHRFNDCLKKVDNLKPLERVGLLANGNLQYLFSSYYDQPVDISINKFDKLEDDDDDQVLVAYDREVTMKIQGHSFCRAKSTLRVYSDETLEILSSSPIGIGQLFNLLEVLPKFTLLDVGRNEDGSLWRSYSLQSDKHLQCIILEEFTVDAWSLDVNVNNKESY